MKSDSDYKTVERSIRYLEGNFRRQPSLEELSSHAGMSTFHFQRVFTRWAGVSPKRFLQFLTLEHAKGLLRDSQPVLATAFASGLSGPARLHDLFVHTEGVTPGEYKKQGLSLEIIYGFHDTPFGTALLGNTERGLCHLVFLDSDEASGRRAALEALEEEWPGAILREARTQTGKRCGTDILPHERRATSSAPLPLIEGHQLPDQGVECTSARAAGCRHYLWAAGRIPGEPRCGPGRGFSRS